MVKKYKEFELIIPFLLFA